MISRLCKAGIVFLFSAVLLAGCSPDETKNSQKNDRKTGDSAADLAAVTLEDKRQRARELFNQARSHVEAAEYGKARDLYSELIDFLEKIASDPGAKRADSTFLGSTYTSLGNLEVKAGNYDQARAAYEAAYTIHINLLDTYPNSIFLKKMVGYNYRNRGLLERKHGDRDKALEYFEKYRDITLSNPADPGYESNMSKAYLGLGHIAFDDKNYESALKYYKNCARLRGKIDLNTTHKQSLINHTTEWAYCHERVGDTYRYLDNRSESLTAFQEAYRLRDAVLELEPESVSAQRGLAVAIYYLAITDEDVDLALLKEGLEILDTLQVKKALRKGDEAMFDVIRDAMDAPSE